MDRNFHARNRQRLSASLQDGEAMLFFSGEPVQKSADEHFPFFANRNFLYLTGITQERSALLLHNSGGSVRERLFVTLPDVEREVWTGRRLTETEIQESSGVETVEDIDGLGRFLDRLLSAGPAPGLWLCFDPHRGAGSVDFERQFARKTRQRHPQLALKNSYPLLARMRMSKEPEEIAAIRTAMQITGAGIERLMRTTRPGIREYELEAEFNAELAAHGQRRTAFPSIVAGGERIFYLHYSQPVETIAECELVLADVGAAYEEYCTDISRVFPASGRFSERQAQIYRIAWDANRAMMEQVRPGVSFADLNQTCREISFEGLRPLGLLDDLAGIRRYVWHGAVHHVGLDTHDVGISDEPMAENMVFTVDAGIYVREWGIGLRIEDNVRVTADGCENLSASIPSTIEEIERLMAGPR